MLRQSKRDRRENSQTQTTISHTSFGSVIHSTGQAKNGAMASTDTAPAAAAAARRRHPPRFLTRSLNATMEGTAMAMLALVGGEDRAGFVAERATSRFRRAGTF